VEVARKTKKLFRDEMRKLNSSSDKIIKGFLGIRYDRKKKAYRKVVSSEEKLR